MNAEVVISFAQLSEFAGDRQRMITEGDGVLQAGHIIIVGKSGDKIKGACLQSSKIRDKPHEINLDLNKVPWKCHCSCKAGGGSHCKHIFAVLLFIFKYLFFFIYLRIQKLTLTLWF